MSDQPPNRSESGASGVREFAARTKLLLNESERQYMYAILREYRTYKQLDALVLCLRSVLDTPVKMDLLKDIRRFVEHSQLSKYDELVPYHKMAHPWANNSSPDLNSRRRRGSGFKNVSQSTDPQSPKTSAKGELVTVYMQFYFSNSLSYFKSLVRLLCLLFIFIIFIYQLTVPYLLRINSLFCNMFSLSCCLSLCCLPLYISLCFSLPFFASVTLFFLFRKHLKTILFNYGVTGLGREHLW